MSQQQSLTEKSKILIREDLQDADVIKSVPGRFNRSYETFRKKFLLETGESPGRFCRHLRIELAKTLLIRTDWKCFKIAIECGYTSARVN